MLIEGGGVQTKQEEGGMGVGGGKMAFSGPIFVKLFLFLLL
jgi:hypothetical protein